MIKWLKDLMKGRPHTCSVCDRPLKGDDIIYGMHTSCEVSKIRGRK